MVLKKCALNLWILLTWQNVRLAAQRYVGAEAEAKAKAQKEKDKEDKEVKIYIILTESFQVHVRILKTFSF